MVKNAIIALLAAIMISGFDCCAYCRGAMLLGMFAAFLVLVCYIEEQYLKECARRRRMRRLKRRIAMLTTAGNGGTHEREI